MAVRLPFRLAAPGARSQCQARLVVGRPCRRPGHGPIHSVARPQRNPRGALRRRGLRVTRRMQTPMDRRGIVSFLAITFGITYAIEGALILAGFRVTEVPALYGQFTIAAVMWVPTLAPILTVTWVTREGFDIA